MQQAYQALRVISEAQTIHIVLATRLSDLMLTELRIACEALQAGSSDGIKAVVLDFAEQSGTPGENKAALAELLTNARAAVRAVPQPVLAVVRTNLSAVACSLLTEVDFILIAHEAEIYLPTTWENEDNRIGGMVAARLGYATWNTPAAELQREMERVLDMLRTKSALALRHAKASVNLGTPADASSTAADVPLEALRRINQFYLETAMITHDAQEGLRAFLEKRPPQWQNH